MKTTGMSLGLGDYYASNSKLERGNSCLPSRGYSSSLSGIGDGDCRYLKLEKVDDKDPVMSARDNGTPRPTVTQDMTWPGQGQGDQFEAAQQWKNNSSPLRGSPRLHLHKENGFHLPRQSHHPPSRTLPRNHGIDSIQSNPCLSLTKGQKYGIDRERMKEDLANFNTNASTGSGILPGGLLNGRGVSQLKWSGARSETNFSTKQQHGTNPIPTLNYSGGRAVVIHDEQNPVSLSNPQGMMNDNIFRSDLAETNNQFRGKKDTKSTSFWNSCASGGLEGVVNVRKNMGNIGEERQRSGERRFQQNVYRADLERQLEQKSRQKIEEERKLQSHPLGPNYEQPKSTYWQASTRVRANCPQDSTLQKRLLVENSSAKLSQFDQIPIPSERVAQAKINLQNSRISPAAVADTYRSQYRDGRRNVVDNNTKNSGRGNGIQAPLSGRNGGIHHELSADMPSYEQSMRSAEHEHRYRSVLQMPPSNDQYHSETDPRRPLPPGGYHSQSPRPQPIYPAQQPPTMTLPQQSMYQYPQTMVPVTYPYGSYYNNTPNASPRGHQFLQQQQQSDQYNNAYPTTQQQQQHPEDSCLSLEQIAAQVAKLQQQMALDEDPNNNSHWSSWPCSNNVAEDRRESKKKKPLQNPLKPSPSTHNDINRLRDFVEEKLADDNIDFDELREMVFGRPNNWKTTDTEIDLRPIKDIINKAELAQQIRINQRKKALEAMREKEEEERLERKIQEYYQEQKEREQTVEEVKSERSQLHIYNKKTVSQHHFEDHGNEFGSKKSTKSPALYFDDNERKQPQKQQPQKKKTVAFQEDPEKSLARKIRNQNPPKKEDHEGRKRANYNRRNDHNQDDKKFDNYSYSDYIERFNKNRLPSPPVPALLAKNNEATLTEKLKPFSRPRLSPSILNAKISNTKSRIAAENSLKHKISAASF